MVLVALVVVLGVGTGAVTQPAQADVATTILTTAARGAIPAGAGAAAPLIFTPAGAVVGGLAVAGLAAWFIWGHNPGESVGGFLGRNVVCPIFGGSGCAPQVLTIKGAHQPAQDPYGLTDWQVTPGANSAAVRIVNYSCTDTQKGAPAAQGQDGYCATARKTNTWVDASQKITIRCRDGAGQDYYSRKNSTAGGSGQWIITTAKGSMELAGPLLFDGTSSNVCAPGDTASYVRTWQEADPGCPGSTTPDTGGGCAYSQMRGPNFTWDRGLGVPTGSFAHGETTCRNADGSTQVVVGAPATDPGGIVLPGCPTGSTPIASDMYLDQPGEPTAHLSHVGLSTVPQECLTEPPATSCSVDVYVDGQKCEVGSDVCWDWPAINRTSPERVQCIYAGSVVPTTSCEALDYAYRTGSVAPDPGGSGDWLPTTPTGAPVPEAYPNVTEKPAGWPYGQPAPQPTGNPSPTAQPTGSTGPNPNGDPAPDPDGDSGNCWAGAISFNPFDWVLVPVKCALQWAFVPPEGGVRDVFSDVANPGLTTWLDPLGPIFSLGMPTGDCAGPSVHLRFGGVGPVGAIDADLHPLSWCEQPQRMLRTVIYVGCMFGIDLGAILVAIRLAGAAFGVNLGIGAPPTPVALSGSGAANVAARVKS